MSRQAEGKFKEEVVADLRADFGKRVKILATQERARKGVLDLILCLYGDYVAIELKVDGEEPTELQQKNIDETIAAGGTSFYSTPSTWPTHREVLRQKYDWKPRA